MNDGFFPRASDADRNVGWDIDTSLLKKIADTTEEMNPYFKVDMESVESVLLSLEQLGWKVEATNLEVSTLPHAPLIYYPSTVER